MTHTQSEDNMTSGWKTVKLGEICTTVSDTYHGNDSEVILINTSDVLNGKILNHSKVPNQNLRGQFKKTFKKGDILYSEIRPANKRYAYVDIENTSLYIASTKLMVLRPNKAFVEPKFLMELLTTKQMLDELQHLAETRSGTFPQITFNSELAPRQVSLPPLDVQRRIAAVLKPLDDKIELNARINARLERVAQALFKRQFVRFEREKRPFSSLIQICGGGTPKTDVKEYWNGDIPFFTPKDANNTFTFKTEKSVTQLGIEHCNSPLYPANTTFITARDTVGKVSMAGIPMAMNQSCYALTSDVLDPILVYFYAQEIVKSLRKKASGAVFDAIVTRDFSSETISMLSDAEANEILSAIKPLMNAIHLNLRQSRTLARLRDVLLPRLMSGAVDVGQVRLNTIQEGGSR